MSASESHVLHNTIGFGEPRGGGKEGEERAERGVVLHPNDDRFAAARRLNRKGRRKRERGRRSASQVMMRNKIGRGSPFTISVALFLGKGGEKEEEKGKGRGNWGQGASTNFIPVI